MATTTLTLSSGTSLSSGGNSGYRLAAGTTAYTPTGTYKYTSPSYPIKITAVSVPWFGYSAGSSNITVSGTITVKIGSATFTGTLGSTTLKTNTNVTGTVSCTGSAVLTTNTSYTVSVTCSGSNLLKSGTRLGTNGKSLTGTYAANTYTIAYNANGHGTAPASQTKTAGTTLTLRSFIATNYSSESTVTITGNKGTGDAWSGNNGSAKWRYTYTQTYWNTNSSGTGTNYGSAGSYTANAAATLYAIWKSTSAGTSYTLPTGTPTKNATTSSSMTVTFNPNKGQTTKGSQTSVKTTTYSFKGWFTASSGGTQRTTSSRVTAAETVYAQFNSSTGAQAAVTLPTTSQCTRLGYTLLGFSTSSTATTATYNPGASYTPSATITLYAVWSKNNYTLTFDANGGECSETSRTVAYNTNIDDLPIPTRSGYKFVGWGHDFNGSQQATWGRDMMYTNQISVHLSAYMDNWSLYTSTPMRMISCTEGGGWNIEPNGTDGYVCFQIYKANTGYNGVISPTKFSDLSAGWHTFDMIFDGTAVTGYIDGVSQGSVSWGSGSAIGYHATNGIFLGCEAVATETTGGAPYFTGSIANITIRNNTTLLPTDTYTSITSPAGNWTLKAYWEELPNNYIKVWVEDNTPITDLQNTTWTFKSNFTSQDFEDFIYDVFDDYWADVPIICNNISYPVGFYLNESTEDELYYRISHNENDPLMVYTLANGWVDESYKTFTFGTYSSDWNWNTYSRFIDWLYDNATLLTPQCRWQDIELQTYIGSSRFTDLTGTTWYFNETVDCSINTYFSNLEYIMSNEYCTELNIDGEDVIYNEFVDLYISGWEDPSFRTIEYIGGTDTTNTALINWMYDNAALVSPISSNFVKYPVKVYTNNGWQIVQ